MAYADVLGAFDWPAVFGDGLAFSTCEHDAVKVPDGSDASSAHSLGHVEQRLADLDHTLGVHLQCLAVTVCGVGHRATEFMDTVGLQSGRDVRP